MDDSTVRKLGFLLAAQARVFGMVADNEAQKAVGNPPRWKGEEFNVEAFHIENIARQE